MNKSLMALNKELLEFCVLMHTFIGKKNQKGRNQHMYAPQFDKNKDT